MSNPFEKEEFIRRAMNRVVEMIYEIPTSNDVRDIVKDTCEEFSQIHDFSDTECCDPLDDFSLRVLRGMVVSIRTLFVNEFNKLPDAEKLSDPEGAQRTLDLIDELEMVLIRLVSLQFEPVASA
jgi:hypothetical protein